MSTWPLPPPWDPPDPTTLVSTCPPSDEEEGDVPAVRALAPLDPAEVAESTAAAAALAPPGVGDTLSKAISGSIGEVPSPPPVILSAFTSESSASLLTPISLPTSGMRSGTMDSASAWGASRYDIRIRGVGGSWKAGVVRAVA